MLVEGPRQAVELVVEPSHRNICLKWYEGVENYIFSSLIVFT